MSFTKGMNRNAIALGVAAIAAICLFVAASGAEASKKKRGSSGTLTVKTVGLPKGTPVQITVSGRKNTVRRIQSAGSKTLRRLPLGRYVIRATATRFGSEEAAPDKPSAAVQLTKRAPKRLIEVRYRVSTPSDPGSSTPSSPAPASPGGNTPTQTVPLRFNVSGADGLGIRAGGSFRQAQGRSGVSARAVGDSNLAALVDGRLVDAVESSTSPVNVDYLLVRDDAAYVVFREPISLETGQPASEMPEDAPVCIFARVDKATEDISCVDSALSRVGGQLSWVGWLAPPPVQFGADGSIYYSGQIGSDSVPVLRRKAPGGEITTVFSRDGLDNFVLLPSGKIAVRTCLGGNCGTPEHLIWTPSSGEFQDIPALGILQYMVRFADDNLYFGNFVPHPTNPQNGLATFLGIRSYDPIAEVFNPRSWVMASWLSHSNDPSSLFNPRQDNRASCANPLKRLPLCEAGGFLASSHLRVDGKDYLLIKTPPNWNRSPDATVIQAYPNVQPIEFSELETVEYMVAIGNQMIASGLDGSRDRESVIARENLGNGTDEQVLLDDPNFTVLGLDADQSRDEVIYYGFDELTLDFVLGRMDLDGNLLSEAVVEDPNFRLSPKSFQSFG